MATNVTQKDKTLNEIMAYCDQLSTGIKRTEDATTDRTYGKLRGHVQSHHDLSYRRRPASKILWAMVKAKTQQPQQDQQPVNLLTGAGTFGQTDWSNQMTDNGWKEF